MKNGVANNARGKSDFWQQFTVADGRYLSFIKSSNLRNGSRHHDKFLYGNTKCQKTNGAW